MLCHLVLLKPRADLAPADRRQLVEAFDRAVRGIPSVRNVTIGARLVHGAAYEVTAPPAAAFMVSLLFDDLDGLRAYLAHPLHEELGIRFWQSVEATMICDYEVGGVERLDQI